MIRATLADRHEVAAFLNVHAAMSMFPLSNLARHGMQGGHPRACNFWIRRANGQITDVLTQSDEMVLFPQCPTGFDGVAQIFAGQAIKAVLGESTQVADLRAALGVTRTAPLDVIEPAYQLDLSDLIVPDTDLTLYPLERVPRETLIQWRAAYHVEALSAPLDEAVSRAVSDIDGYIAADSHRSLWDGAVPVAMTGFNATLPDIVQIGGVYTPPDLRSRGYARRALALHLQQVAAQGVVQAVLFAANSAAEAAYRAIGFQRAGRFAIAFYDDLQVVHG